MDAKGTLYATCDLSRKFLVIDPKTRTITAAIDTEGTGHWIAVLPDGSKAYVANKNDRPFVSVIDIKARKMIGKVDMPNGTQGITVSPDGKQVLAVDYKDPKFMVIDTATDKIVDTVAVEQNRVGPFRVKYSPDGSKLVTCDSQAGLANIINTADLHGKQTVLTVGKTPVRDRLQRGFKDRAGLQPRRRDDFRDRSAGWQGREDLQGRDGNRDAGVLLGAYATLSAQPALRSLTARGRAGAGSLAL